MSATTPAPAIAGGETVITAAARCALSLTIYNGGQALIRDTRTLPLQAGQNRIAFRDVAATIRAETSSVRALAGSGFTLLEQNYEFDLLSPDALLEKYLGREITVLRNNPASGLETAETATVLATNYGTVLRYADRIETGVAGRLAFASVPANLRDRPTLSMLLDSPTGGAHEVELMYLADEMNWQADYIAQLNASGDRMQLNGWVTLTNRSGASFENARLQLVAGTLNRAPRHDQMRASMSFKEDREYGSMDEEKLADYHLYTLNRATTILEKQTKQVALLAAADIPVHREYVLLHDAGRYSYRQAQTDTAKGLKPAVFLHFDNKDGDLGIPIPSGTVRVYMPDASGAAQLLGEDAVGHTAKGEQVAVRLGEAFDITAQRTQTDFQALTERAAQSSYRIEIRNAGDQPVTVSVREYPRQEWSISRESLPHIRESAGSVAWQVKVPASGTAVLEYTAVARW